MSRNNVDCKMFITQCNMCLKQFFAKKMYSKSLCATVQHLILAYSFFFSVKTIKIMRTYENERKGFLDLHLFFLLYFWSQKFHIRGCHTVKATSLPPPPPLPLSLCTIRWLHSQFKPERHKLPSRKKEAEDEIQSTRHLKARVQ